MKAITIFGPNDIRMTETERPRPGPDEALVRVAYCGICGTDLAILGGEMSLVKSGAIKYPVRIGHEWSGVVEEVGAKVRRIKLGDRVVSESGVSCGTCPACLAGNYGGCKNGRSVGTIDTWPGAFAEYMLMPERHLYKVADGIELDEAALIEPATVAFAGVGKIDFSPHPSVLVIGTGAIGLAAVGLCQSFGASKVLLSGRKPSKLAIGRKMGADAAVNATTEDVHSFVMDHTGGHGVNAIVETSGNPSVINSLPGLAATGAVIPLIGFYERGIDNFDIDGFVYKAITLQGILGEYFQVPKVIDLIAAGKLRMKDTITHRYPFDQAIHAMKTAGERADTKIKMLVELAGG